MTSWHWIVLASIGIGIWMLRYDLQSAASSDGAPLAYIVDRWTGAFYVASPAMYRKLNERPPAGSDQTKP